MRGFEGLVSRK
jgi:hypothetical protein